MLSRNAFTLNEKPEYFVEIRFTLIETPKYFVEMRFTLIKYLVEMRSP